MKTAAAILLSALIIAGAILYAGRGPSLQAQCHELNNRYNIAAVTGDVERALALGYERRDLGCKTTD